MKVLFLFPIKFSAEDSVKRLFQVLFIVLMFQIGLMTFQGMYYYIAILIALILSAYQQKLIQLGQREFYFKAFLNNNTLGAVIFLGLFLDYALH